MRVNFLRGRLFGRLLRASLAALPLVMVLCLCVTLVGLRGRSSAQELHPSASSQAKMATLAVSQAKISSKEATGAAYQRQHILHAVVRVPQ
jgi:hypothetical protein